MLLIGRSVQAVLATRRARCVAVTRVRCGAGLQLAAFLAAPMERAGGLMTLPDVFCLFNRARGLELVSPDDLLQVLHSFDLAGGRGALPARASAGRVRESL